MNFMVTGGGRTERGLRSSSRLSDELFAIPIDRLPHALFDRDAWLEAHKLFRLSRVNAAARISSGFACIENAFPPETRRTRNEVHQLADTDLGAGSDVHRCAARKFFRAQQQSY